ncbi:DUF6528 family protein [Paenibacillus hamazuiensis]|uniref:DUF6528 family protein n=1 Tax=Paenibacillus hamazuiensis TaxID=2936508 RepID=UPI00200EAAB2|nr:DUF6528 family protein [Paenibacillus hamazuiensis]
MLRAKDGLIAGCDQASSRILIFDPADSDWNGERAVKWAWSPSRSNGFDDDLVAAWGLPTDAKVRTSEKWGGQWMVVTDSKGLAAIVSYPEGDGRRWAHCVGGNPHSAELLPDGNLAVASSTGGFVRLYASSQGPSASAYAEYRFPGAHGVHWDARLQLLWALGDDELVALAAEGTAARPVLREARKTALPTRHGHDLQPVHGDPDRLWISTGTCVYQYVKSADAFDSSYPGHGAISRPGVKSVGNLLSGTVVSTVPKKGSLYDWTTDTVQFALPEAQRVREGAAFYKARILNPIYE